MINQFKSYFLSKIDDKDRFGFAITGGLHLLLLVFALLYHISMEIDQRPAYIEVTLGEYEPGMTAERAEVQPEETATRPNPAETEPDDPDPDVTEPVEIPEEAADDPAKEVELAEQEEEIIEEEVIRTPETERIDPETQQTEEEKEEVIVPPHTREAEEIQEGEERSGDERGTRGEVADQGTGQTTDRAAPYDLRWEGELDRSPTIQPLPENIADVEAVISVRFEVHPNGTIGRIIPLRKMNPELEREVMRTLRSWRFSTLPSGVPQEAQWGTITFRFVFE